MSLTELIKKNMTKIIVAAAIIAALAAFFLIGALSAGMDISYIPI